MISKVLKLKEHASAVRYSGGGACVFPGAFMRSLAAVMGMVMLAACGLKEEEVTDITSLTIYSPAPPSIMLHEHNVEFGSVLNTCQIENSVIAVALPQSVNQINRLKKDQKPYHLPIVTTIDFLPAISKGGPDWHAYDQANADLKFVAALYDVIFGILAFDDSIRSPEDLKGKRIAAPPRPSAVRVYTEALLLDGWGILEEVEIVDMIPPDLPAAIKENRIDATSWSLLSKTADGFRPMMPMLLSQEGARWIETDVAVAAAINTENDFKIGISVLDQSAIVGLADEGAGAISLLSFKQALAAWETTPEETVQKILACIEEKGLASTSLPHSVSGMVDWPDLIKSDVHDGALEFYHQRNIDLN